MTEDGGAGAVVSVPLAPGADPVFALVNFFRPRQILLILDNCEHLLDASAAVAELMLGLMLAILCVGAIEKQPAVITVDGADMIAVRTKGMLALAFDHRIVDGADADRFMADVKAGLQDFPESGA